jgi:hypothetical protein
MINPTNTFPYLKTHVIPHDMINPTITFPCFKMQWEHKSYFMINDNPNRHISMFSLYLRVEFWGWGVVGWRRGHECYFFFAWSPSFFLFGGWVDKLFRPQVKPKENMFNFLLPQANGWACVDLGAPIQLIGCFEVYPSICWVSSQNTNVG